MSLVANTEEAFDQLPHSAADVEFLSLLGEGACSKVYLSRCKSTGRLYAIKVVNKSFLLRNGKSADAKKEKLILLHLHHPNVVKMFCTYQCPVSLYFVLELCARGDLEDVLKQLGPMPVLLAQFWMAEIVNIVEYLQHRGIAHRDLKPENFLVSNSGHLKLADFDAAKILPHSPLANLELSNGMSKISCRSYPLISAVAVNDEKRKERPRLNTFVGTLPYISPEMIDDKGVVGHSADLWSAGVILYRMLVGRPPFSFNFNEKPAYDQITSANFRVPPSVDVSGSDLLHRLLRSDPMERIGSTNIQELKRHEFFKGINFATLPHSIMPSKLHSVFLKAKEDEVVEYLETDNDNLGNNDDGNVQTTVVSSSSKELVGDFVVDKNQPETLLSPPTTSSSSHHGIFLTNNPGGGSILIGPQNQNQQQQSCPLEEELETVKFPPPGSLEKEENGTVSDAQADPLSFLETGEKTIWCGHVHEIHSSNAAVDRREICPLKKQSRYMVATRAPRFFIFDANTMQQMYEIRSTNCNGILTSCEAGQLILRHGSRQWCFEDPEGDVEGIFNRITSVGQCHSNAATTATTTEDEEKQVLYVPPIINNTEEEKNIKYSPRRHKYCKSDQMFTSPASAPQKKIFDDDARNNENDSPKSEDDHRSSWVILDWERDISSATAVQPRHNTTEKVVLHENCGWFRLCYRFRRWIRSRLTASPQ